MNPTWTADGPDPAEPDARDAAEPDGAELEGAASPTLAVPILVAVGALAVYRTTLLPSIGLWDTAEFQTVAPVLGVAHPTGYPAYVLLGFVWSTLLRPLLEPAAAMNLLAAVCAAVGAGLTVEVVRRLTGNLVLGLAAGVALAATPAVWAISTRADPHALHLALVVGLCAVLLAWAERARCDADGTGRSADRFLLATVVLAAIAVGNHSLTALLLPGIALFVVATEPGLLRRPRFVLGAAGMFVALVALLYLELPLRAGAFRASLVYGHPETWDGFVYIVSGAQFRTALSSPLESIGPAIGATADMLANEFGPLAALVPVAACVTAVVRPRWALLSVPGALITCLFAASYANADIGRYYLGPIFFAWTWLAVGAASLVGAVLRALERAVLPALRHPRFADAFAFGLAAAVLVGPTAVSFTTRRATVDASRDRAADTWLAAALDPATGFARNAVVVSWWDFSTPLWYAQQIDGRRPDLTVVDDRTLLDQHLGAFTDVIDATLGRRPVYAVRINPADIAELEARYVTKPLELPLAQTAYEIVRPRSGG